MGTTYNIKYHAAAHTQDRSVVESKISRLLEHINQKLSTWRKDSEITRFNKYPHNTWFPVSPELYTVTRHALKIAAKTSGVFDPTLGPLINLWGFGPQGEKKVPSAQEMARAKAKVGYRKLHIKPGALKKSVSGMYLDLSASAKGYGVDRVAELLEELDIDIYMVEIGGEIRAKGGKQRPSWKIGVEAPTPHNANRNIQNVLQLSSHALATSGNYRNFFTNRQKHYSHIIDSSSGKAEQHTRGVYLSVTVLDSTSCMNADAWATALSAMGWEKGINFATKHNLPAHFVYRLPDGTGQGRTTGAFKHILKR